MMQCTDFMMLVFCVWLAQARIWGNNFFLMSLIFFDGKLDFFLMTFNFFFDSWLLLTWWRDGCDMFQRCVKKWIRNDNNIQYSSIFQPIIYSIFQHIPTSTLVHQGRSAGSGSFPGKLAPRFWATREHTLLDLVMLVVWNRDEFSLMMFLYVFVAFSFFPSHDKADQHIWVKIKPQHGACRSCRCWGSGAPHRCHHAGKQRSGAGASEKAREGRVVEGLMSRFPENHGFV